MPRLPIVPPASPSLEPEAPPLDALPLADPSELETFGRPSPAQEVETEAARKKLGEMVQEMTAKALVPEATTVRPNWAIIPPADAAGNPFRFPKGRQILFIRLRAEWTDTPTKGERQIICWPISTGDYTFAVRRAQGDPNRVTDELTMQMIRAIDGHPVNWGEGTEYSPAVFWNQIGQRCRYLLTRVYLQANTLSAKETSDFFTDCISVVSTG